MRKLALLAVLLCGMNAYAESYKIGVFGNNAPFATHDENGTLSGMEIDIWKAVAQDQKFEVEFFEHQFPEILTSVENGSRDAISAGFIKTKDREEQYTVSDAYFATKYAVATLASSGLNLTEENLQNYHVAVLEDSMESKVLASVFNVTKMQSNKTIFLSLKSLAQGKVDAYFTFEITLKYILSRHPESEVVVKVFPSPVEDLVFLMKKGNSDLQEKFNTGLRNIRSNGKYDEIVNKWTQAH